MRQLGGIDTMFVRGETPSTHMHVAGVLILDAATMRDVDPRQQVRRLVAERLPLLPPFRWRLVETPGGIGAPRWIEDPDFDLDRHLHLTTLPRPGTRSDLERLVGALVSTPLERDRPLWEMHVVDGLADGSVAVVSKLHHAFMDGGAGAEVMASLFDLAPGADAPAPDDDWEPESVPPPWRLLVDAPGAALARVSRIPRVLVRTATDAGGLLGAMFPRAEDGSRRLTAPRTPFNGPLGADRVVSLADCSLTDVKRVKSAFGVTVNDVVLAAVASSLRAELIALDALGERPLVAAVPVSVRTADGDRGFGNHTSAMMVPLPTHIEDPVERLRTIHDFAVQTKEQHASMDSDLLENWAGLVPPWAISVGSRLMGRLGFASVVPPVMNVIASNVQGPPIDLFLAGARVTATYPLGPLMEGVGLNVTVISQCDALHVGLVADPGLVEHPDALAAGLEVGVDELLARIPTPRRRRVGSAPP